MNCQLSIRWIALHLNAHQFLQGCPIGFPFISSIWCKTTKVPNTKYAIQNIKHKITSYKFTNKNVFSRWVSFTFDKVCAFSRLLWNILTHFVHHFTSFNMFSFLVFVHWASSKVMRAPGHSCRLSNYPFSLRKPEKTWDPANRQILITFVDLN